MAERICPKCGAAAGPTLKFCRECGARVDAPASADAATGPVEPVAGADDATLIGAAPSAPPPDPEESEEPAPPAAKGRAAGAETLIAGKAARAAAAGDASAPGSAPAGSGDETIISGALRARIAAVPPPAGEESPEEFQKTFIGTSLPGMPKARSAAPAPAPPATPPSAPAPAPAPTPKAPSAPTPEKKASSPIPEKEASSPTPEPPSAPAPSPPAPPRRPEREPDTPTGDPAEAPVHDDLGVGDGIEEVLPASIRTTVTSGPSPPPSSAAGPPASPPSPPPEPVPGPPPPAVDGAPRLEHWSPRVKGDVVTVEKDEVLVGRDRGDLRYPEDNFLSKKHARFFRDGKGSLCVEDLGTLNGTYLRLTEPARLEHRDVLVVGRHAFRFELLEFAEKDDRTLEGDPLTRVQGIQGRAPRARLVKRQDEGFRGLPYYFGTQRYVLGRTDGTHNFQRDDRMSRRHAALQFRDGDYWLEDLGSQNGTFIRLRGARVLRKGDVVMMGDQYFKYV